MDTQKTDDTMKPVDEYKALRDSLLYTLRSRDQFLLSTLVVTAAIWGWAFTNFPNNDPNFHFIFLLPLAVIIPNMFYYAAQVRTGKKIGSYLHVFHEIEKPGWGRRSSDFKEIKDLHVPYTSSFAALGLICIIIFIWNGSNILTLGFIYGVLFALAIAWLFWSLKTRLRLFKKIQHTSSIVELGLICIIIFILKIYCMQILGFIDGALFAWAIVLLVWAQKTLLEAFDQYKPCKDEWVRVQKEESKGADKAEPQTEGHHKHQVCLVFWAIVAVIVLGLILGTCWQGD